MNNYIAPKQTNSAPQKEAKSMMAAQKEYVTSIGNGLKSIIGEMDAYQAVCGYNILCQINVQLMKDGLSFKSPEVDKESINNAIKYAIVYRLNTDNKEVFTIVRNEKRGKSTNKFGQEEYNWMKVIEVKPQYRGTLKILSDYGRDVVKVYPEWIVREGDDFKYPHYKGVKLIEPEWEIKNPNGKIVRVVVPVEYSNGFIDYRIAERESVATNIKAQIKQSLQGKKDDKLEFKKEDILQKIANMSLDELLSDKTIAPLVNETYTGLSKEEMLITKLVINAVKRVQIDYSSALARELNEKTFDNSDVYKPNHNAEQILALENKPMDVEELEHPTIDEDGVISEPAPIKDERVATNDPVSLFDEPFNDEGE